MAKNPRKGKHFRCVRMKRIKVRGKTRRVCADFVGKGGWYGQSSRHRSATRKGELTRVQNYLGAHPQVGTRFFGL